MSGLAGGATGLLSATGAGPVAMGIMGGVSSGASEIYHQMQSGEDINWGQVAVRTLGGAVSGAVLGNVGSQTASGAKEIAKNAGKVFLANGGVSFAENLTYNLIGGEDLGTAAKQASFSALISGGTSAGFYALGQAAKNMCFVEGTMVLTAAGLVAIESIAVGDMVVATDPETRETAEKQVKNTFVNETEELAHVFVDGEEIVCTPGHKFYAPEKGWTSAIKLRAGDQLQLVNGEYVTVEKVQHELLEEPVKIYNFEVEDFHTYYVGTDVQVLVHNMCKKKDRKPDLYHYTTAEGAEGIRNSGVIAPDSRGRVFVTMDELSPESDNNSLLMGTKPGVGTHVVEIYLNDPNDFRLTAEGATQPNELIYLGAIRDGKNADLVVKENTFG